MLKVSTRQLRGFYCINNISVPDANRVLNLNIVATRNAGIAGETNSFICVVTKTISGLEHAPATGCMGGKWHRVN